MPAQHVAETHSSITFALVGVYTSKKCSIHKRKVHLGITTAVSLQLLQFTVQLDHILVMLLLTLIAATAPPFNIWASQPVNAISSKSELHRCRNIWLMSQSLDLQHMQALLSWCS